MTTTIIWTIAIIAILGAVLAIVLYLVAEKFKVEEDPRIDEVEKVLPGANCGGCGQAGCRAFAQHCVESSPNLDGCFCNLIYLDAAKGQYPVFLPECIRLLGDEGMLISDNVLFRGQVCAGKPDTHRNQTIVNRLDEYLHRLKGDDRLITTVLPISDGMTISVKRRNVPREKA